MKIPKRFKTHEEYLIYYRNYRKKNAEKIRKYNREYNRKWRKENGYHNEKNSKLRYPEKEKARKILIKAVYKGEIIRGKCEVCGIEKTHAHHEDYNKPLDVRWLCPLHHKQLHFSRCG